MIVGIDLGTTNSLVAYWHDGQARLIPNALGQVLTPSCVSLDDDGSVLVGQAARDRLQTHSDRTAALFKRHMGSDKPYPLGSRQFRPEELSALVLRALKEDAETALGTAVTEAVISVPAYFSDSQRKATRTAAQLAGLHVERLINEPTAAALAYGLHQRAAESQFLVFDLGGGTFDVSILELFEGVMEVRATAGDNFLGGEDFANEVAHWFCQSANVPRRARDDNAFMQHLRARVEAAKIRLSDAASAPIEVQWKDQAFRLELTEEHYRSLSEPLLQRLRAPLERALRDAGLRSGDIQEVVLAGGATRTPMIRNLVTRMFGRFPSMALNPDEVVAQGAAVMAGLKARDAALREVVMTDVCPYSLGIETTRSLGDGRHVDGQFSPIIERNTVVPVSRVREYLPVQDGQKEIYLPIFQGESRMVRDNIKIGELTVALDRGTRADGAIEVRFTYDVNGILEVEVTRVATGELHRAVIRSHASELTDQQIAERFAALAELKIHPRDKLENRSAMAEAERIYAFLRGHAREIMGDEISLFEAALLEQHERNIETARARLRRAIEHFDRYNVFDTDPDPL
ncbi:Hsp70 family protein [Bordetella sp. BOR01]|uniref:Hsp70 family protein n=1 Tax=Bordetella sp. BOR01 TaxID=2854779 RepID=UPI001C46A0C6|nr:molecular chaperone HscC [Bordetella sp. BOR01]MBV7483507.1 molecular chaperone HscC [Bordetella sp. BOR01]